MQAYSWNVLQLAGMPFFLTRDGTKLTILIITCKKLQVPLSNDVFEMNQLSRRNLEFRTYDKNSAFEIHSHVQVHQFKVRH